jgi:uncharacterized damage-inducible protein DinB
MSNEVTECTSLEMFKIYAAYNSVMNNRILDCCGTLEPPVLLEDLGAYFGSILGTLNHLINADEVWLSRFTGEPHQIKALDQIRFDSLEKVRHHRTELDKVICQFVGSLDAVKLQRTLSYVSFVAPQWREVELGKALLHFFNHQTHHRGQITTLLFQKGRDPGLTDLISLV